MSGSFIPFATTRSERLAGGDPRQSLEERYADHTGFVDAVKQATAALIARRFLLAEDAETIVRIADESSILRGAVNDP